MSNLTDWESAIHDFDQWLAAGGAPATTRSTRRQHLEHAARRLPVGPWQVNGDLLVAYCSAQEWKPETRRGRRSTFRAFYGRAVARGTMHLNPADALPVVRPAQPKPRPAPDEVYAAALAAARPRERLMLRLSAELGLRRAEVAAVHVTRDLWHDSTGAWLTVHGKGRKDRNVPVPGGLAAALREAGPGFAFPGADDGHLSPRWVGKLIARIMPDTWTMHTLRHRFGTAAYAVDRDLLTVQQLLGHASPATTRVYVRLPPETLRTTVVALAS